MKIKQRLMAVILTVVMMGAHLITLGNAVMGAGFDLSGQGNKTNHANVEFDSYLENGNHEQTFETSKVGKIILKIKVSNTGYLKNGIVRFSNANFEIDTKNLQSDKVYTASKDEIQLKQINNSSSEVVIEVPIIMTKAEQIPQDQFYKMTATQFTATYIDGNGKEKSITKEIKNSIKWQEKAEIEVAGEISKYLPYQIGEEYGVLVQAKIQSGLKNNSLPIAKTNLEIGVPEIKITKQEDGQTSSEAVKPNRVTIVANTKGTNGENGINFNQNNYQYNQNTNKVEIQVENTEKDGKISWNQTQKDEYLVNYIYTGKNVYDAVKQALEKAKETQKTQEEKKAGKVNENAITGEIQIGAKIVAYDAEQTIAENSGKMSYRIEEEKGNVSDVTMQGTQNISKGYIYANYAKAEKQANGQKVETNYEISYEVIINDKELANQIELKTQTESYEKQEGKQETSKAGSIATKKVKIAETIFNKMLGEEGSIEVLTTEGKSLGVMNKETTKDAQGNYVLEISAEKVNEMIIKTSNFITEGRLEVAVEKAINGEQSYTKAEMESFKKITLGVILEANKTSQTTEIKENTDSSENITNQAKTNIVTVGKTTASKKIELTEPVSKAEISVDTENLSTIVENKDVEFRVVLDTSSKNNALYQNPVLEIELPENIETLKIKDVNLFLEDELKIKDTKVENRNGKKVIVVTLEGTQTKYMDNGVTNQSSSNPKNVITKGANIVITADITFQKLTPSKQANITLYYTNQNTNLYEKGYSLRTANSQVKGVTSTQIEVVSPNGVVTENSMSGFTENGSINNVTSEKQEKTIDTYSKSRELTIGGTIVNNHTNSLENVFILGRIPFAGNKAIDSNTELGSNFTIPMSEKIATSGIDSSKIKIYYSTNGEATKDLLTTTNNWTENPANLAEVKSYLIVFGGEVPTGTKFSFSYFAKLPENLNYENSSYTTYKVYYDNKAENVTTGETRVAGTIGLTTGKGPAIEVNLNSNIAQNSEVREGQIVRLGVTVKNTGEKTAEDVTINVPVPKGTAYTKYNSAQQNYEDSNETKILLPVGNLKQGETATTYYNLKMLKGDLGTVTNQVKVAAKDFLNGITSNEYVFNKAEGKFTITVAAPRNPDDVLHKGDVLRSSILVEPEQDLTNVVVNIPIPDGMKIQKLTYQDSDGNTHEDYVKNGNQVLVTLPKITAYTIGNIQLVLEVAEKTGEFSYMVSATADGLGTYYSNNLVYHIGVPEFTITQSSSNAKYIKEAEQITYKFTIQNTGNSEAKDFVFEDVLPEGLSFVKLQYTYDGQTEVVTSTLNNTAKVRLNNFKQGGTCEITVIAKANLLPGEKQDKEVTNIASIEAQGISKIQSNSITNIIEKNPDLYEGNDGNQGEEKPDIDTSSRYKITGTAWLDTNKDGKRDETEEVLSGIEVMLVYKSNSSPVTDVDNGTTKITKTDENGKYEFSNLKSEEYLVIFLYDAGKYSVTEYQEKSVGESYNSDAMTMKITLDGKERYAGVTDTIKLKNGHARDIDIGLYVAEKFDLKLDKYITKVTVTTPTIGTKTYEYNNSKLAKQEVLRQNVNKSSLVIEYKIVVTNEGQIPGYVRKIIDYLPEDVKFSTELNKDWYISNNQGAVYNTSLANEKINPGESKEVKLVLTLNITDKNIGSIINNNAEIYESYNEQGIQDYDSTEANKLEKEDDMSNADIMLSIVTGKIVLYTTLILSVLFLLTMGIIVIQRKVLTKKQ